MVPRLLSEKVYRFKNTEVAIGEDIGEEKCKGFENCFLKAERWIFWSSKILKWLQNNDILIRH